MQPGEQCDDGNSSNDDGCLTTCVPAACGDGFVYTGVEQCDDGNMSDDDACLSTCVPAACGDGFLYSGTEQCDDGNTSDDDACVSTCVPATCGDGCAKNCAVEHGFTCDAGSCASQCGDGLVASDEGCDDGNTTAGDGCAADCKPEAGFSCQGEPSVCKSLCGDGALASDEECDDGNLDDGDGCSGACAEEPAAPDGRDTETEGGCSCGVPKGRSGEPLLASLALLGLVVARRRSQARRALAV